MQKSEKLRWSMNFGRENVFCREPLAFVVVLGIIHPLVIKSLKVFLCRAAAHFVSSLALAH
jgi:hypothetical protein